MPVARTTHPIFRFLFVLVAALALVAGGCRPRGYSLHHDGERKEESPVHIVAAGDTITNIAQRYRVQPEAIIEANRLRTIDLYVGQRLVIPGGERLVVRPIPPPPRQEVPDTSWYIARAKWAVEPIDLSNITPMGRTPYRITVHHSADDIDSFGDTTATLRHIEHLHKLGAGKNEPFACIGYHFIIASDGRVWEGRPLQYQGAHATGANNEGNIGICLLGNFDKTQVPKAQRDSLIRLLDRLCAQYQIVPSQATVMGHQHFKATNCPGRNLEPIVEAYARGGH